ncbi:hypothetical protein [Candidiatus Paracoxiella cheracis]|uniref:hypothetical protein n=1 Tax=Candidiatus Paracoxiella cheracis TaxID=3405120 RepID=UPI003BF512DF
MKPVIIGLSALALFGLYSNSMAQHSTDTTIAHQMLSLSAVKPTVKLIDDESTTNSDQDQSGGSSSDQDSNSDQDQSNDSNNDSQNSNSDQDQSDDQSSQQGNDDSN